MDAKVKAAIAAIPPEKRVVITSHDAFGYFENAYGLTFRAPQGISTDSEASAADVAKLVEQIRAEKASAIFVENITNGRLAEQIASETGLKVGGTLFSDALSPPDGPRRDLSRHDGAQHRHHQRRDPRELNSNMRAAAATVARRPLVA